MPEAGEAEVARRRAERLASVLPPLQVAAERVAQTVAAGVHGRRRIGQGDAFWQFRRYGPGDAAQRVDWRQSGRTQALYVRETEWEAAQSVWLWRDRSPSTDYRSTPGAPTKRERGELLLMALAALLLRGGERVGLLGEPEPAAQGRGALGRLVRALAAPAASEAGDGLPPAALPPRHANLVLMSDFFVPLDALADRLAGYAARGATGHLLQIVDPAEPEFPFSGRVRFEGPEREGETLVRRAESVRAAYRDRFDAHRQALGDLARSVGWTFGWHCTDATPEMALLALHAVLARDRGW